MSLTQKFIRFAFGTTGTRTAVPDPVQGDGTVSYQDGYNLDYQRAKTDPLAKNIERDKMNQLFYDWTLNQQQYQLHGVPEFIPAADNGGVAVSYAQDARVLYTDGFTYTSLVAGNNVVPGTDATKWRRGIFAGGGIVLLTATGTIPANAASAQTVFNSASATVQTLPAANSVAPGQPFRFLNINAGSAAVTRAGADVIQTNASTVTSLSLGAGDTLDLISDGVSKWYAVDGSAQLGFAAAFGASMGGNGWQKLPSGLIIQWGTPAATDVNGLTTFTHPIAFPNSTFCAIPQFGAAARTAVMTQSGTRALATTQAFASSSTGAAQSGVSISFVVLGN